MNAIELEKELRKITSSINKKSTKRQAIRAAIKVYRLKVKWLPTLRIEQWENLIMDVCCPLCVKYRDFGDCLDCPLIRGVYCCTEWETLRDYMRNEDKPAAVVALNALAEKIFTLKGK